MADSRNAPDLSAQTGRDLKYAAAYLGLSPHTVRSLTPGGGS